MAELNIRPKTGGDSHVWLWAIIVVAVIVMAVILFTR